MGAFGLIYIVMFKEFDNRCNSRQSNLIHLLSSNYYLLLLIINKKIIVRYNVLSQPFGLG